MGVRRMASVYQFADRLVVIADHRTEAGLWSVGEPVIRLDLLASDATLGAAVQRAILEGSAVLPALPWRERAPILAALAQSAGFRTWAPFDRRARLCSIRGYEDGRTTVMPMGHGGTRGDRKGFHERMDLEFDADLSGNVAALGAAVRRGLELSSDPPLQRQPNER